MGRCTDLLTLASRLLDDVGWGRTAVVHFIIIVLVSHHVVRVGGAQARPSSSAYKETLPAYCDFPFDPYEAASGKTRKGDGNS
jgi:hypothetical protein